MLEIEELEKFEPDSLIKNQYFKKNQDHLFKDLESPIALKTDDQAKNTLHVERNSEEVSIRMNELPLNFLLNKDDKISHDQTKIDEDSSKNSQRIESKSLMQYLLINTILHN